MSRKKKPMVRLKDIVVPDHVKEAWETVAIFLNDLPELSFHISPWHRDGSLTGQQRYTLHTGGEDHRDLIITAKTKWKSGNKP